MAYIAPGVYNGTIFTAVIPLLDTVHAEALVFHVDIFILALIALLVLLRLPRAFARLWSTSEWCNGHILLDRPYQRSTIAQSYQNAYPPPNPKEVATEDSHTLFSHSNQPQRIDSKGRPLTVSYPPHVASSLRFLRPLISMCRHRISPGFSAGQFLVLLYYFSVLVYAAFYKSSPFTDPLRAGWVAIGQLPFVFAFATKNNILGAFLGMSYSQLNFIHRFVGRLVVVAANVHGIGYFYQWSLAGSFMQQLKNPFTAWGLVALVCLDCMFLFSTSIWRQKAYVFFLPTHTIGAILVLPALWLHMPSMLPYVLACAGLYGFDYLLRIIKTRISRAFIRPLPELSTTRIEVPGINAGWHAGQHVRVRVMSSGMGWWGWTEVHPFTIASVARGHEGLVLLCKKSGSWTGKLYEMAKVNGYTEGGIGREVSIMIEGPYGGSGHAIFASFSGVVIVVGGSGITFALSLVQDLIQKDLQGKSKVKVIDILWTVQDPTSLLPLVPLFMSIIQQSIFTPVRISVHYTRAPLGKFPFRPQPGLTLSAGRPRIAKVLDTAISRAVSLGAGAKDSERITGLLVAICGPVGIGDEVAKAVGLVEPSRRDQVGGIEMHEEVFGF